MACGGLRDAQRPQTFRHPRLHEAVFQGSLNTLLTYTLASEKRGKDIAPPSTCYHTSQDFPESPLRHVAQQRTT
jgi:hypothetical protein